MNGMAYVRILRDLREDADKTQTQIAEVLGTSQTMYARYERGANEMPIHHLITLSKYYGVSTDYLLGLEIRRALFIEALTAEQQALLISLVKEFESQNKKIKKPEKRHG